VTSDRFRFEAFVLDASDRQLLRDGSPVELSSRYLDALALMVREAGKLVTKDRFMGEVWRGVPVTDEALTQCIRTLRRQLGDNVARPQFIETVPKHGYRFIAPVEECRGGARIAADTLPRAVSWRDTLVLGATGTIGGGMAGFIGGLIYGFAGASDASGVGGLSVLLVILCVTIAVALIGGAGVSFGIALADRIARRSWWASMLGGATGGLIVGAVVKLLGLDAFTLLFGHSPAGMTGALEGTLLGGGAGLGAWVAGIVSATARLRRGMLYAAISGAAAGLAIALAGGRLMAGSLELLAQTFPDSHLRLGQLGAMVGDSGFGSTSRLVTSILEGALFSAFLVGGMVLGRRSFDSVSSRNEQD
jgi:DNA-binding winged helix-turn-helix (wHTH) protein